MDEHGKILELRKPYLCGYRGPDPDPMRSPTHHIPSRGEDLVRSVLCGFLGELDQELAPDKIEDFFWAVKEITAFYMALLCPNCRQKVAERLLNDIPAMLARASELVPDARDEFGEYHLKEK
jgi:hypothetical protein